MLYNHLLLKSKAEAKKLSISIGVAVAISLNDLDIGTQIAKQLDKRDKRANNGW